MSNCKRFHATMSVAACACLSLSLIPATSSGALAAGKHFYRGHVSQSVAAADKLLVKGNYAAAADHYRAALKKNPKDMNAAAGLGLALTKLFKLDGAEEQFDKVLSRDPQNPAAHAGKAMVLLSRLQSSSNTIRKNKDAIVKEAEGEAEKALAADPQIPEAHYAMGMVYKEQWRWNDAVNEFKSAVTIDPKFADSYSGMGLVKLSQNNPGGAAADFRQAIKVNSGDWTAHYGLGQALLNQGQVDASLKELNTALYQFPNSWPVHLALGKAYETQGNTVAAVREYQESIRVKPENSAAYLGIANIRESRGDIEHSIAELRSGLELMPDSADLHQRIGEESLRVEKLDDAIKEFENVLTVNPGNSAAADGLTNAYYLKAQKETTGGYFGSNDYEDAQRMLDRAVQMNPNDMRLRLAQAKLRALSGDDVDLSAVGQPRNDGERISYAQALLAMNHFQESTAQMNTVIANAPNAKQTFAVGDLALMMHDLDSAQAAYQKASGFPGSGERARRGLAQVSKARVVAKKNLTLADDLARKKMSGSAVDTYHDAVFANPKSADARLGLARTLESISKRSPVQEREAAAQYRAYVALSPALAQKDQDKFLKRAQKLDGKATKLESRIATAQSRTRRLP
jgi:tetratricopeptide (TPR) repeat protein